MSRSRRTTRPGPKGGKTDATKADPANPKTAPNKPASAAFATAHQFADHAPAATDAPAGQTPAKAPAAAKAGAGAAAAGTTTAGGAATKGPTTTAAETAGTGRSAAGTAAQADRTPAESEPAKGRPTTDPYLEAAAEDEAAASAAYGVPDAPAAGGHPDDLHHDHLHERSSVASTALMLLVGAIVVAALTLWLAPKIAPRLPAGVAQYLTPAQSDLEDRITEIEARLGEERAAFEEQRAAFDAERTALGDERGTVTGEIERLQGEIEALAARVEGAGMDVEARAALDTATGERTALSQRMAQIETGLQGMRDEIAAMNEALAAAEAGEGPTTPELAAALAQLQSRVETLASDIQSGRAGIDEQIAGLGQRLDSTAADLSARLDQAMGRAEEAETARAEAEAAAESAAAAAALNGALAELETRFRAGDAYAEPMAQVEDRTGTEAPEALAAHADTGLPTAARLAESLSPAARDALAASRRTEAGDDPLGRVGGWFRSQVSGRPTVETGGDSVGAILSRAEARLEEGDASAALAEIDALPAPARAALGEWSEDLAARAAAEKALADWRASFSAEG